MSSLPSISVVIPVFNDPKGLAACLEALAAQQTKRSFEVVVIDDASTQDLSFLQSAYAGRLNLQWHRLDRNSGPATARNVGIKAARGDIILFTDADCRPEPQWIESLAAPFADPKVRGAKGVYKTDQRDAVARLAQLEFEERYELLASHSDIDFVDTYSGAFRREDLLAVGGFDTTFRRADNEDVDLSFRIKARGGRFVFVPEAVVWHKHREGWSNYARLKFGRGYWRMKVYEKHPNKAGRDSYTPWTLKVQLLLVFVLPFMTMLSLFLKLVLPKSELCAIFRRALDQSKQRNCPGISNSGFFIIAWFFVWFITCIPMLRLAARREPGLLILVPFFLLVRAFAITAGMTIGILASVFRVFDFSK